MKYTIRGGNNDIIELSPITIGCWALAGKEYWGGQDRKESIETLYAALDAGINSFDTAPIYGDGASEELLGDAFKDRRGEVTIATKVGRHELAEADLRRSCEESLRRLKTEYIDLFQVHWPSHVLPLDETIRTLQDLQAEGKIRAFGVSNFGPKDLQDWFSLGGVATTNQIAYSLLARAVEMEVVPRMLEKNMKILAYSPLMQGLLTGKFPNADSVPEVRARSRHFRKDRPHSKHNDPGCEDLTFETLRKIKALAEEWNLEMPALSLAWLLHQQVVGSVIVGVRSRAQLEDNLKAASIELSNEQVEKLSAVSDELKTTLGSECDMWMDPSRIR